jgi:hypothetical protein
MLDTGESLPYAGDGCYWLRVPTSRGTFLVKACAPDPLQPWLVEFREIPPEVLAEYETLEFTARVLVRRNGQGSGDPAPIIVDAHS